jgi:hypothetical protein
MVWTNVKSSAIKQIAFRSGLIYIKWHTDPNSFNRYGKFTKAQFDCFRDAPSIGQFYHAMIRNTDWTKVRRMQEELAELVKELDPDYGKMLTAFTSVNPMALRDWIGEPELEEVEA